MSTGSVSMPSASEKPSLVVPGLSNSWINSPAVSVVGSTGTVKFSSIDYDGDVNALSGHLSNAVGSTINLVGLSNGDHSVVVIATDAQSRNKYEKYNFTYDNAKPTISNYVVSEDDGAWQGRVDGNKLSGRLSLVAK